MKVSTFLVVLSLMTTTFLGFPNASRALQASDSAAVEKTLTDFSTALAIGDSLKLRDITTNNFALVDEGRVFDYDSTIASIQGTLQSGKMTRVPGDFHTQVRSSVSWSRYVVTGVFRSANGEIGLNLIETAVLEKIDGKWKVAMVTTLPKAK